MQIHLQFLIKTIPSSILPLSPTVGVLHSYSPLVSTGRDGKPRTHQVVQLGRSYHQMLYTLLHEVQNGFCLWGQFNTYL